jgi:16S rRNA (guanine527-N7)-methyltransferase
VVSRAVTELKEFYGWTKHKFNKHWQHNLRNGILYLKGGDPGAELAEAKVKYKLYPLSDYFEEPSSRPNSWSTSRWPECRWLSG